MFTEVEVLEEIKKLQFFNGLKHEMRYDQKRSTDDGADTVAEHVYGMHILFDYFWPLEDPEKHWDQAKMRLMINYHDLDEVVVGDVIGYLKTAEHKAAEVEAMKTVLESVPQSMRDMIAAIVEEYETRETTEAKFVKAIDKIEPVIQLLNDNGKELLHRMGTTREQHDSIKLPYFLPFPTIKAFYDVAIEKMDREGYFAKQVD